MDEELQRFAQQVIADYEAIASEWFGEGRFFAEWTAPANTYRWAIKLLREAGIEPAGRFVATEGAPPRPPRDTSCSQVTVQLEKGEHEHDG